jgi:hypothetical protein
MCTPLACLSSLLHHLEIEFLASKAIAYDFCEKLQENFATRDPRKFGVLRKPSLKLFAIFLLRKPGFVSHIYVKYYTRILLFAASKN